MEVFNFLTDAVLFGYFKVSLTLLVFPVCAYVDVGGG